MYYSQSLGKISYTTEIGTFNVSDLTSYFILENTKLSAANVDVSSNTTLLELSNTVYSDVNLFWYFLYANNAINPFNLFDTDTADLLSEYSTNTQINSTTLSDGYDVIVPEGSLILPWVANSGDTYSYGSTGNFSLTGGFGFIKEFNPFTKVATIIQPIGGVTFAVNQKVNYLVNGDTYSSIGSYGGETRSIQYVQTQLEATKEIKYEIYGNLQVFGMMEDDLPITEKTDNFGFTGATSAISYQQYAQNKNTNIQYYLPYTSKSFQFTKITQNYIV
jgi:hypothetical protein